MSDSYLKLIPIDPEYVPAEAAIERAVEILEDEFDPESVTADVFEDVNFIDAGSNFERISCPNCGADIDIDWWGDRTDEAYEKSFSNLSVTTPCCGYTTSLNDLDYYFPVGYARFLIEIFEPGEGVDDDTLELLEQLLDCELREIYAHY